MHCFSSGELRLVLKYDQRDAKEADAKVMRACTQSNKQKILTFISCFLPRTLQKAPQTRQYGIYSVCSRLLPVLLVQQQFWQVIRILIMKCSLSP